MSPEQSYRIACDSCGIEFVAIIIDRTQNEPQNCVICGSDSIEIEPEEIYQ